MAKTDESQNRDYMRDFLDLIGVRIENALNREKNYDNDSQYIKVDASLLDYLNPLFNLVPDWMNKQEDIYRVVFDKGLGVLQKSAKHPGMYLGNVVSPEGNNHITAHALLQEVSVNSLRVTEACFSAASVITGQYFLKKINRSIESLDNTVDEIQQFLEEEKKSQVMSDIDYLEDAQERMQFIIDNETLRIATVSNIQRIKNEASANIKFYGYQINHINEKAKKNDKDATIREKIGKMAENIANLWNSLYVYCFAASLEPVLAQNYDSAYLDGIIHDIEEKKEQYERDWETWNERFTNYINEANAYNENKVLKIIRDGSYPRFGGSLGVVLFNIVANLSEPIEMKIKNKKQERAKERLSTTELFRNTDQIDEKLDELMMFGLLSSGYIEFVKKYDSLYVKVDTEDSDMSSRAEEKAKARR